MALVTAPRITLLGRSRPRGTSPAVPVLPDLEQAAGKSQCARERVVLPDSPICSSSSSGKPSLNAPAGAWCSLTRRLGLGRRSCHRGLNAPAGAWCSLTGGSGHWDEFAYRLNAPTGAWCSLTWPWPSALRCEWSQCTYRCVVLPDGHTRAGAVFAAICLNAPTGAWCSLT